ncbi:MAG: cupin domain-containing protein [Chromatiales bacterium]|nr:cupin domain-containing protein [Chromatiales bacterium]
MSETTVQSIADLPAQRQADATTPSMGRARYFNTGNAFNMILPPVPDRVFAEEPAIALDPSTPTGLVACDIGEELGCPFPATSPFVLAYYARINAGDTLTTDLITTGVVAYVIEGSGQVECGDESVAWGAGDVFVLPGGVSHVYCAPDTNAVLWLVTNEPQLAFENLQAPLPGQAPTAVVHYPAAEMARQITLIDEVGRDETAAGAALVLSSESNEASRNALPTLTVAMNSLPPGVTQRPHRHNSVAVSLVIQGGGCFSTVDGRRKDWSPWCTTITPPVAVHPHSNHGNQQALFLIIQDGGLYYQGRTMGFEFVEDASVPA